MKSIRTDVSTLRQIVELIPGHLVWLFNMPVEGRPLHLPNVLPSDSSGKNGGGKQLFEAFLKEGK